MTGGALLGAGLSAGEGSFAAEAPANQTASASYLFVHGAWHTGLCWSRVIEALTAAGKRAYAMDLPGSGLNARFPRSYLTQDLAALDTEVSPLKGQGLRIYVDAVAARIRAMSSGGKVILVGHSFGGMTVTKAAEAVPDLIQRVVYVTAYVPVRLPNVVAYNALPENGSTLSGTIKIGDPNIIGAVRINNRSTDPAYIEKARQAFYNDVATEDFLPFAASLVPDIPLQAALDDARGTPGRWGTLPRSFIRCTLDHAIPIALQDRMIAEADASTPDNKFDQYTLTSSHSPFASMPGELSAILASLR